MKFRKGFTLIELLIAMSVTVLVTGATALTLKQVYGGTGRNNSHLTAVQQVETAGYWISRDAQVAEVINTTNLTSSQLVTMNWTVWDYDGNSTYHSVNYSFYNMNGYVGQLKRSYGSSTGENQQTCVGYNLYYNPAENSTTSQAIYLAPMLTVRLTSIVDNARETRQYVIKRRPDI